MMKAGGVQTTVTALISIILLLAAASPAGASHAGGEDSRGLWQINVNAQISPGVLPGGPLEVERAHAALRLFPAIAPPSLRAWRLSDAPGPVVDGRAEGEQVFIDRVTLSFTPVGAAARGEPVRDPGATTVVIVPDGPARPCASGGGSPATAAITYFDEGGRVESLTAAVRISCHDIRGGATMTAIALAESGGDPGAG